MSRAFRLLLIASAAAIPAYAQQSTPVDRTAPPPVPAPRPLVIPTPDVRTLSNGARLIVTRRAGLPLVAFTIWFEGGGMSDDPPGKAGTGSLTAELLSEGTTARPGPQFGLDAMTLGTRIFASVDDESGSITLSTLKQRFVPAMDLVADMLTNASITMPAFDQLRSRTVAGLESGRSNPNLIASRLFAKFAYGSGHPYGALMSPASVASVTREDVMSFYRTYFRPGRAIITVAGDVDAATVQRQLEAAFREWPAGGEPPRFAYPSVPVTQRTIYLVDKPGAPQSVFAIGLPGPPRSSPDFLPLVVMNNALGGLTEARLNRNLRATHGYVYDLGSRFAFGKGPGAWQIGGGGVITAKSDSALLEILREIRGIRGEVPLTDEELKNAKAAQSQGVPRRFATLSAINTTFGGMALIGLPMDYYSGYVARVNALTRDDLVRVARTYLDPDRLTIVVVGDRSKIEAPLRQAGVGPVIVVDQEGKPVP